MLGYILLRDGMPSSQSELPPGGEYGQLIAAPDTHFDFPNFDENSIVTTFHSTGTTSTPKGVCFSYRQPRH